MPNCGWNRIPSIIIVEILTRLSLKDRLNATSTCCSWRECLFHPSLWQKIVLVVNSSRLKTRSIKIKWSENESAHFLANRCGRFVRDIVIKVNSKNPIDVKDCADILEILTLNCNLHALTLRPTSCRLEWSETECRKETPLSEEYIALLLKIISNVYSLRHLSLGCIEELLDHSECLMTLLGQHQSKSLVSLHLASIKEDPDNYPLLDLSPELFDPFCKLQCLSIDYDYLSDELIHVLSKPNRCPLKQFLIHVHGIDTEHRGTSDNAWYQLRSHSSSLEVTITLLHSNDPATLLQNILHPSMPLVTFRSYFSEGVDDIFLDMLAALNGDTLKSVVIVESLSEDHTPTGFLTSGQEDPLVMLAWRCQKLSHMTVIGYEISEADLIAIARLRGPRLKVLHVPACCISMYTDNDEVTLYLDSAAEEAQSVLLEEMSSSLAYHWTPLAIDELPQPVANLNMDADGTYLPVLLEDQAWIAP